MSQPDLSQLKNVLADPASLITDLSEHEQYCHDATAATGEPLAVVLAESEADVVAVMRFCAQHRLPVVPRGGGTGLSGGAVPMSGSLVLSTERIDHLSIDPEHRTATCGPGLITKALQDAAAEHGLAYPPDPASYEECTLGGNVAEGAGGLRCKRFGVTKDYVMGIKAVTATGEPIETGVYTRHRGFTLADVLISSEGTLAVIVELTVRLIPAVSKGSTLLVAFNTAGDAARTVTAITTSGIVPAVLEFVDGDAAAAANEYEKAEEGLDKAGAILLIETDGTDPEGQTAAIRSFCKENHCSCLRIETDHEKADELWQIRRNISKASKALAKIRVSEDVAVPNSRIPDLVEFIDRMNAKSPVRINCFGHAGDGNIHANFMGMTGSDEEREAIEQGIVEVFKKVISIGGTLTGEHGIGTAKKEYLGLEFDRTTIEYMRRIKEVFDPGGILNPGKVF